MRPFFVGSIRPREPHPQFLDHRPHRPRQVDARRSLHPALRRARCARDERAGARFDGPGARTRHHDQGADGGARIRRARRRELPPQHDRHAGPRRLRLRSLALAGRVRGCAAGRRCVARGGSADGGQLLHGARAGRRGGAGAQQDRPAVGRPGAGDRGNRGHHRHRRAGRHPRQRQDRRRCRRHPRGGDRAHPAARGGFQCAVGRIDHRLVVRQLRRGGDAGAHDERHAQAARPHPADGHRRRLRVRIGRRVHAEIDRARRTGGGRRRLRHRRHQGAQGRAGRRHR